MNASSYQKPEKKEIIRVTDDYSGFTLVVTAQADTLSILRRKTDKPEPEYRHSQPTVQRLGFYLEAPNDQFMERMLERTGRASTDLEDGRLPLSTSMIFPNLFASSCDDMILSINDLCQTRFNPQVIASAIEAKITPDMISPELHPGAWSR